MTIKITDTNMPGKILENKYLDKNKEVVLQLVELTSDTLEPGTYYMLMRLIKDEGGMISQYPTDFQKQKKLGEVKKMYNEVSCIGDFERLTNPDYNRNKGIRELVAELSFMGGLN